jgi:predicted nucleic acid-binding protein
VKAVVDANIWLAASDPHEPFHTDSAAFLRAAITQSVEFIEPNLALVEVAASTARRTQDAAVGHEAANRLKRAPGVQFFDLDIVRAESASDFASRLFLRGADATYAALAHEHQCGLVTLDEELRARASSEVATFTPAEWIAKHALPPVS